MPTAKTAHRAKRQTGRSQGAAVRRHCRISLGGWDSTRTWQEITERWQQTGATRSLHTGHSGSLHSEMGMDY